MKDFNFKIPQNIQFGMGSLKKLPEILAENHSDNILLVSDRGLEKIGVVKKVQEIIEAAGLKCTSYLDVVPNPTVAVVNEATALYKECGATSIVALGGGSSMDVGKAVGVLVNYGGKITDYEGNHKVPGPIVPMIAIPTTAGTGSEADAGCVITNPETNEKIGMKTPDLFPVLCIEDPELMKSVPAHYTAYQGFDALSHSLEGYISKFANLMSDMYAITAIENVGCYLARAVKDGNDIEARTHVAFGNILSGTVMCVGTTSSQHSLEHALSAYHPNLPHGAGLIMLSRAYFGNVIAHHACDERFICMAKAMGMENADKPEDFLTVLQKLLEDCGVADLKMSDYGITPDEFPKMADNAMGPMGGLFACDRVALTKENVIGIYQKSYK